MAQQTFTQFFFELREINALHVDVYRIELFSKAANHMLYMLYYYRYWLFYAGRYGRYALMDKI